MLNEEMDQVILVKGWKKGANWSFPRGKINKDESDLDCAVREVYEETGYDVDAAGLVEQREKAKYIDVAIQHQHIRLYVFRGVPMHTQFEARTRKEISKIEWWKLSDLPTLKKKKQQQEGRGEDLAMNANKFYMVAPFLVPLKKWISQQKRHEKSNSTGHVQYSVGKAVEKIPTNINGVDGNKAGSTSEDMERLFAGLRQPSSVTIIDHTPAPNSSTLAQQASMQLKNLLRVPTKNDAGLGGQKAAQKQIAISAKDGAPSQENKASTLLALLKGAKVTDQPQTPLENIIEPLSVPKSPEPQHATEPRLSTLPPPPVFHLHRNDSIQPHPVSLAKPDTIPTNAQAAQGHPASINAWNAFETVSAKQEAERQKVLAEKRTANLVREEQTGIRQEPGFPVMHETWRQVKIHDNTNMFQPDQRRVTNVVQRPVGGQSQPQQFKEDRPTQQRAASSMAPQPIPAPYQATSNVQVLGNSQYQDIYRPTIPAANKLPMPKLTAHSSSLLDLFKDNHPGKATKGSLNVPESSKVTPSRPTVISATANDRKTGQSTQDSGMVDNPGSVGLDSSTPSLNRQQKGESKRSQSSHQGTLLDLFRKPSVQAAVSTPPLRTTLDVPTDLVELSAMPSPSHSRQTSQVDSNDKKSSVSPSTQPSSMQKRNNNTKHGNLPVSATVNGPLNVPQFEMIARKVEASGRPQLPARDVKKSPVKILARPSSMKAAQSGPSGTTEKDRHSTSLAKPKIPPPIGLDPK
ncbi:MAG: hypothetical protein Q9223_005074, partial [Gallowayella weberi]